MIDVRAGEVGLLAAVALGMFAGHGFVPERQFKFLAGAFVGEIIVAVGAQRHRLDVGARPDDMDVLAAFLFMQHDGARLAVEAQLALQYRHGLGPLLRRHGVAGVGVDIDVVKPLGAARALGEGLPVAEGRGEIVYGGIEFQNVNALVGVGAQEVGGKLLWTGA